jgi:hypothetical protein
MNKSRFSFGVKAHLTIALCGVLSLAYAATFNLYSPATGIQKNTGSTYINTAAASSDVTALWSGTCNASSFLRGDGACAAPSGGSVTSVGLTMPSGFSVGGSPVTSSGTLTVTTTLSGVLHGNGSGLTAGNVALGSEVSGTLPVGNGGTGATTLTGPLKGNGTSAFTAAVSSDIYGLWSGTCNSSTFLRGDGSCQAPAGSGTTTNAVTFNNSGTGDASGTTFNGSVARTISYNTLGAPSTTGTNATGTWGINISGSAASATTATSATSATSATTAGSVTNSLTFNNGGAGDASGTTYNGGAARILSYNSIGAPSTSGTNATGTWGISISGNAAGLSSTLGVASGGTGATTLSGVLKGNGTSAIGSAASSDVITLWSGTCNSGTFLAGDGSCQAAGSGQTSGTFTGTFTGFSGSVTCGMKYRLTGSTVTLFISAGTDCTGTSNATTFTMTGLPGAIQPTHQTSGVAALIYDNSTLVEGASYIAAGGSTVTFSVSTTTAVANKNTFASNTWTNSGTKGLHGAWQWTYDLGN